MKTIHQDRYHHLIALLITQRKNCQLTQNELANRLGKPQSFIAKIEAKDRKMDILEFVDICAVLTIDTAEILDQIKPTAQTTQNNP